MNPDEEESQRNLDFVLAPVSKEGRPEAHRQDTPRVLPLGLGSRLPGHSKEVEKAIAPAAAQDPVEVNSRTALFRLSSVPKSTAHEACSLWPLAAILDAGCL